MCPRSEAGGTLIFRRTISGLFHFFSPYYRGRLGWKLRNTLNAFKKKTFILEETEYLFYTVPEYVIQQTEAVGLRFVENERFREIQIGSHRQFFLSVCSYVFEKPRK